MHDQDSTSPRILAVDDSDLVLRVVRGMLARVGFEVVMVSTPRAVIEQLLPTHSFVALIADEELPHMGGVQLVKHLRLRNVNIPALIMTRGELNTDVAQTLTKPFTAAQLVSAISNLGIATPAALPRVNVEGA